MMGKAHKSTLLVLTDRTTLLTRLRKVTDLRKVSHQRIKTVEQYLNFRPIQKFDYLNFIQQILKHRCVALIT